MEFSVFWFRRDLRLTDNTGLNAALHGPFPVLGIFIFDEQIIDELPADDARITFIYRQLFSIQKQLSDQGSSLLVLKGDPRYEWLELISRFSIRRVYFNHDYEPYARNRDSMVIEMLEKKGIDCYSFKDQVIFEKDEVVKGDGKPYTVFTPYKNKWLERFRDAASIIKPMKPATGSFANVKFAFPTLEQLAFRPSSIMVPDYRPDAIPPYARLRDNPSADATSLAGPHLRFGTVSIRECVLHSVRVSPVFLGELIWREFFMQILFHFPEVIRQSFRPGYDAIEWRNDPVDFQRWTEGSTGYPMVDAGMRQLDQTGFMHNRVRMITASFLTKHLLIDWRWGEAYFAKKLLDYELSSNNGNWQWAAGSGCDAAPYFRVFNPTTQQEKFDPDFQYCKKWVPEFGTARYPKPMVEHKMARLRAIEVYKKGLGSSGNRQ